MSAERPGRPSDGPPLPPFGRYKRETVVKEDGRRVHYYTWPDEPAPDMAVVPQGEAQSRPAGPGQRGRDGASDDV